VRHCDADTGGFVVGAPTTIWKPTLDCSDMEVATAFWTWLLGVDVSAENGNFRVLGPPDGPPLLCLQQVDARRSGKNRMHLDLIAEDLGRVSDDVREHGGAHVSGPYEHRGVRWRVMADPEGNEFCLVSFAAGD
jgi:catechol 2,3-dioxygenase-like lactoylglutathione lyase family enzyme